uniref:Uncharacterized protein n=1 Tax=Arundo donax TaxID=35708 RepID=A0A0A9GPP3_ARUDO
MMEIIRIVLLEEIDKSRTNGMFTLNRNKWNNK